MVRLESLLYLQEIAKYKSINKAADKLFLSKSALSTAIKNLENEFGVPLLNRTVHGVSLTAAGENVVEKSNLIFNLINGMKTDCWMYANTDDLQKINFYIEPNFAASVFPAILPDLMRVSSAHIATHECTFTEMQQAVKEDVSNVGFILSMDILTDEVCPDINFTLINSYDIYAVTAKYSKYVPANVKELTQAELAEIPQVMLTYREPFNRADYTNNDRFDYTYNITFETDNNNIYYQAIMNDVGIGQMCLFNANFGLGERRNLRFIPIKDCYQIHLYLLSNKDFDKELAMKYSNVVEMALDF